jgi:UDP-N-acetylmuramate dehydrogenase
MSTSADILRRELDGLEEAVPLAPYSAYRVGGPAEFLYRAATTGQLVHAVRTARQLAVTLTILGRGTNVLIGDAGLEGLTILVRSSSYTIDGTLLRVEAGVELPTLVAELAARGYAGLEFAGNIPGSLGGAVVGNAGAYGRCVSDCLTEVHFLDGPTEHAKEPAELEFAYRSSIFKRFPELVVLSAAFRLTRADPAALLAEVAADAELRRSKHPLDQGSCGSYFKNPSRELPAARLIEAAGLKGLTIGRAQVSEKHANFLVGLPGATAAEIAALAAEVVRRVREHSGYELAEEVRRLGI